MKSDLMNNQITVRDGDGPLFYGYDTIQDAIAALTQAAKEGYGGHIVVANLNGYEIRPIS